MPPTDHAARLTVDLDALLRNYRLLTGKAPAASCAAVVKADAYGLGAAAVAPALFAAGCRVFFVADPAEGRALSHHLQDAVSGTPPTAPDAPPLICVLGGLFGDPGFFVAHDLIPVLNSTAEIALWAREGQNHPRAREHNGLPPAILHLDTGMNRLGLSLAEFTALAGAGGLGGLHWHYLMSHLACADTPDHPLNESQRKAFAAAARHLPGVRLSLANSAGIFLGAPWHFDLLRPGIALYGCAPWLPPVAASPLSPVVRVEARLLQIREIDSPETVGYGATFRALGKRRLAVVALGYADGYLRALSNAGSASLDGTTLPLVGRVSMDLSIFDVTDLAAERATPGRYIEILGPGFGADALAAQAGTVAYEILTSLGARYHRHYLPAGGGT